METASASDNGDVARTGDGAGDTFGGLNDTRVDADEGAHATQRRASLSDASEVSARSEVVDYIFPEEAGAGLKKENSVTATVSLGDPNDETLDAGAFARTKKSQRCSEGRSQSQSEVVDYMFSDELSADGTSVKIAIDGEDASSSNVNSAEGFTPLNGQRAGSGPSVPPLRRSIGLQSGNSQPGAFSVAGIAGGGSVSTPAGIGSVDDGTFTPSTNIAADSAPIIHEAHLAQDGDEAVGAMSSEPILVDGVHSPSNDDRRQQKERKKKMIIGLALTLFVIIVGVVVGSILLTNDNDRTDPIATPAPTTEGFLEDSIRSFLIDAVSDDDPFEPGSLHAMAIDWIIDDDPLQMKEKSARLIQRFALVLLYFQTTDGGKTFWNRCNPPKEGEDDVCLTGNGENRWLSGTTECTWLGVSCAERSGLVEDLDLEFVGLQGAIPSALFLLKNLSGIAMYTNSLAGTIPDQLYEMTKLTFFAFDENRGITGTLKSEIGLLTNLMAISLNGCNLSGTIPNEISSLTLLQRFYVSSNRRLGGSIPDGLYTLSDLTHFAVFETVITGSISTLIGKLTNLKDALSHNAQLSGSIPTEVGLCRELEYFEVSNNNLSGTMATEIGMLTRLIAFFVDRNPALLGSIPTELYLVSTLERLIVGISSMSGSISTMIGLLSNLGSLGFYGPASFVGTIPTEIGLLTDLAFLLLSYNQFSGTIPTEIGACTNLLHLQMGPSLLYGSFPEELGNLGKLTLLAIENNPGFVGTIPESLYDSSIDAPVQIRNFVPNLNRRNRLI